MSSASSTQDTDYQREAAERLQLPFPPDHRLELTAALRLPTFIVENMVLLKRLTLIIVDRVVTKVFCPVFPARQEPPRLSLPGCGRVRKSLPESTRRGSRQPIGVPMRHFKRILVLIAVVCVSRARLREAADLRPLCRHSP